jgi:hypothetical protein
VVAVRLICRVAVAVFEVIVGEVPLDETVLIGHFCTFGQLLYYFEGLHCHKKISEVVLSEKTGTLDAAQIAAGEDETGDGFEVVVVEKSTFADKAYNYFSEGIATACVDSAEELGKLFGILGPCGSGEEDVVL